MALQRDLHDLHDLTAPAALSVIQVMAPAAVDPDRDGGRARVDTVRPQPSYSSLHSSLVGFARPHSCPMYQQQDLVVLQGNTVPTDHLDTEVSRTPK
jgi:hypothetical protein